jgi:hypothetical protein
MAKVIEFYVRDLFPTKVRSLPLDRSGKVIEFPKGKTAIASKIPKVPERYEGNPFTAASPIER